MASAENRCPNCNKTPNSEKEGISLLEQSGHPAVPTPHAPL